MAQDRLIAASAGGVVLLGGVAAELYAAPSPSAGVLDWVVGAAWTVAAIRAHRPGSRAAALGLLSAATWFLATAAAGAGPAGLYLAVVYRGPLLHWVADRSVSARGRTLVRALLATGYVAALVGTTAAAMGTALVAAALAGVLFGSSRRDGPRDLRRMDAGAAALAALLAGLWLVAALDLLPATPLQSVTAAGLLVLAGQLSRPAGDSGLSTAIGSLVLDLGPTGPGSGAASPVSASLAAALADPGLQLRAYQPDLGWRDELGRPAADPALDAGAGITGLDTPGGGRVVLVHGRHGVPETELAQAAAAAAALVLERVRVEAQVRREAEEVRRSAARLVSVNEAERKALAGRLEAGAIARLDEVGSSLRSRNDPGVAPVLDELGQVLAELGRLASGLNPARISQGGLDQALRYLAAGSTVPARLVLTGPVAELDENHSALAYFVSAEGLTNVARHAQASTAELSVRVGEGMLRIEIRDDGVGGASWDAGHGLQGLADRLSLAGGTLEIESPPGGPTVVRATCPLQPTRP